MSTFQNYRKIITFRSFFKKQKRPSKAAKRLLRQKENFAILDGLIKVLTKEDITTTEILKSESNQENEDDKFNRVDIKAKNSKGEIVIVEIQLSPQAYYLERILYGVSKTITEHINLGDTYARVKKVFSISIVYFDLGEGFDYVYHGQTAFKGMTTGSTLKISTREQNAIQIKAPEAVFPEYYIIRVRKYDKPEAASYFDEWLDFPGNGIIQDDTQAPGLIEARRHLQYIQMSRAEQISYDRHIDAIMVQNDVLSTAQDKGKAIGLEEGEAIGMKKGEAIGVEKTRLETARAMKAENLSLSVISRITGLNEWVISDL